VSQSRDTSRKLPSKKLPLGPGGRRFVFLATDTEAAVMRLSPHSSKSFRVNFQIERP
jgi:hypothetical protein